jgi:hypothetical protein
MTNTEIKNLPFKSKWAIYFDYYWINLKMCYEDIEIAITEHNKKRLEANIKYPLLLPNTHFSSKRLSKSHIRSFTDFCNEEDERVSEGIIGRYRRFKDRIIL